MKLLSKIIKSQSLLPSTLFFIGFTLLADSSFAEPYLALKTGNKCIACHINPIGGGARNDFGAYYGTQTLVENSDVKLSNNIGKLTENFRIGGDLRANFSQTDSDGADSTGFETQSGQLYIAAQPVGSRVTFYLDQQIAPGAAISREAFVMINTSGNHYIKMGKIMLPYGLRLEDDSAFIRQATQINFDNSDNGVELGLEYAKATINFAITNGTTSSTNEDDENLQAVLRAAYIGKHWRLGASTLFNENELGNRSMANIFSGVQWGKVGLLAEVDWIEDASVINAFGNEQVQNVSLLEVNAELKKGYNLKLTTEYLDPDTDIDENEKTRHSLILEYTPFAYFQARAGFRQGDDIPQLPEGNYSSFFLQGHVYF